MFPADRAGSFTLAALVNEFSQFVRFQREALPTNANTIVKKR